MSRPIQFRVWDIKNKGYLPQVPREEYMLDSEEWYHSDDESAFLWLFARTFKGRLIWEQYTGKVDKSGREIYEGDVVKFSYKMDEHGDVFEDVGEVHWDDDAAIFLLDRTSGFGWIDHNVHQNSIEVVGNIHENPELIHSTK